MPKEWTKFPPGTWLKAAEIYKEKFQQFEKKEIVITANLMRSRFYNTFNVHVVKAVEEACEILRMELRNKTLRQHSE